MYCYLIVIVLIAFDVVTGLTKAFKNRNLKSQCLREGLLYKCGEIFAVFGGWLFEFSNQQLQMGIDIPLKTMIVTYIAMMEIVSIAENIAEINPEMAKLFTPYLEKVQEKKDDEKRD